MDEDLLDDKLRLAKLYFKSKNYPKALSLFNELISAVEKCSKPELVRIRATYKLPDASAPYIGRLHHPRLMTFLDSRAATYEKIGDLQSALDDCNTILAVNPAELRGYLRLGKLYLKMNQIDKALKNYQIGAYTIKKLRDRHPDVNINEAVYESFKENHRYCRSLKTSKESLDSKIRSQLTGSQAAKKRRKSTDPLQYLDQDVLYLVFGQLPVSQILSCHLVNKSWHDRLKSMIYLYLDKLELKPKIKYKEFIGATKMLSRLRKNLIGLRINRTTSAEFSRIFDAVIKSNFKLKRLENFNPIHFNEFLLKLDRLNYKHTFKYCTSLKLSLKSVPTTELLNLFPNATTIELIVMENAPVTSSTSLSQIVHKAEFEELKTPKSYSQLDTLVVLNNATGTVPFPFMKQSFNLTKLIVTRCHFSNMQHIFGEFLSRCSSLTTLILEENQNLSLTHILTNLVNYKSNFKLSKFIFRQAVSDGSLDLQQFQSTDFHNFSEIQYLDLYNTTLTRKGLLKFLGACPSATTLVLGSCNNLSFKTGSISNTPKTQFSDIFQCLPLLQHLSLVDMNFDNISMSFFERDCKRLGIKLESLDISFNLAVNGVGLLSVLNCTKCLIVDGMYINPDTISLIGSKIQIRNDQLKTKWRQYGVNSFCLA